MAGIRNPPAAFNLIINYTEDFVYIVLYGAIKSKNAEIYHSHI